MPDHIEKTTGRGIGSRSGESRPPLAQNLGSEGGFTIVEGIIAMLLVLLFFVTFTISVMGALRGSRSNRAYQTATVVVTEHLEAVRGLGWLEVAMTEIDAAAPMLDGGQERLLAVETGMDADEELLVSEWGVVAPKTVEIVEGTEYTVWTYITAAPRGLKRVTVLATWVNTGNPGTHRSSTLLAEPAGG